MAQTTSIDPVLHDLAEEVSAVAASPEHEARRRHWADLMALRPCRPVVNFDFYPWVWARELAGDTLHYTGGIKRDLEIDLRFRLWKAEHFPDDTPVLPAIYVPCQRPQREHFPWGIEMPVAKTSEVGSYKVLPPIVDESDIERIQPPHYEEDIAATQCLVERVREVTGDVLPVAVRTDELHWGPFEYVVRLRGMDNLLTDVYLQPELVHRLMRVVTDGMMDYQREREAAGAVDAAAMFFMHVPWAHVPAGLEKRLTGAWGYVHAQSAGVLSPEMYAEFIHPYNCELASLLGHTYYHGCEDLSVKCAIIKHLPGLRLFHISPWTPATPVVVEMGERFVYEVHSHPTNVCNVYSQEEMRREIEERHRAMEGAPHVLTICDLDTVNGRVEPLLAWTRAAREIAG